MKDSFILHLDQYAPIQGLSLEQKGMLLDAVFRFHMGEDPAFPDPVVGMAFAFFRAAFERNAEKYQAVIERNRENGKRGGRPRKAVGCDVDNENPKNPVGFSKPKKADSDADSDLLALGNSKVSAQSKTDRRNVSSASASPSAPPDAGIEPEKTQEFYRTKKGRKLTGKRLETFERFWSAFGFAKGKAEAADSWFDIPKLTGACGEKPDAEMGTGMAFGATVGG